MSFIKALLDGSPIMRLAAANPGALTAPDGSPVIAANLVTAAPADGRPVVAGTTALNEGQPLRYYDVFAGGTLTTPDGRNVIALLLVDATGAATGGAGTLSAGVIAFDGADGWTTGQNPPALATTLPSDVQVGDFYRIEHSQNAFATSAFTAWHEITSDDVINSIEAGGFAFTWDTTTLPQGATSFRLFFGRGANAGAITLQSVASNVINDTLAAPDATMALVQGAYNSPLFGKSQYAAVAAPGYQAVCGADTGVGQTCRANKAAANADFYIEYQIDGFAAGGSIWIGVDDGTTDLSTTPADNKPGENTPGFGVGFAKAATGLYGEWNTQENTVFAAITATGGILPGDRIGMAWHGSVANPVVALSHIRPTGGAPTVQRLGTVTLTSEKPAAVYPYIQVAKGNGTASDGNSDCATLKPKTTDWLGTPPSDGVTYTFAA